MRTELCVLASVALLSLSCGDDTSAGSPAGAGASSSSAASGGSGGGSGGGGNASSTGSGAGGGSGGSGGAAGRDYSSDRGKFFGDSRCAGAGVLLCDGFEDSAVDMNTWSVQGAAPSVDTTRAARGAQSLHVHTQGNGLSLLRHSGIFPVSNNVYWGRMFVWIDALPTAPDWAHWTLVGADGTGEPGEIRVGGQYHTFQARNLWGIGSDGGATGDWTNLDDDPVGNAVTVPTQQWVCLEWLHDGQNHVTEFYWDAVEHPSLATTATDHGGNQNADYLMPTFDSVWVGWWLYQSNPTPSQYDVWIDEVALDGARIGCVL